MQEEGDKKDKETKMMKINKHLFQACEDGNEVQVFDLLEQKGDPNVIGGEKVSEKKKERLK